MLNFKIITEEVDTSSFSCASKKLEEYIKFHALKNQRRRTSKCIVALLEKKLVGYYTTSNHLMEKESLAKADTRGLPGYPVPTLLLGKLAVHEDSQRQGIGSQLLRHLFHNIAKNATNPIGSFMFVVLDTQEASEGAEEFYKKYGFKQCPHPNESMMYIKTSKIVKAYNWNSKEPS